MIWLSVAPFFLSLALGAAPIVGEGETLRVFLVAGQSNAEGADTHASEVDTFPPFVGLAAPQVHQPVRLCIAGGEVDEEGRGQYRILINPEITVLDEDDRLGMYEGCLSVPGMRGWVERPASIKVVAWNEKGLIEARLGLELTPQRETVARITYQRFFRRYLQLAGMTVRIKRRVRPGDAPEGSGFDLSPEYEDLAAIARTTGQSLRELEALALALAAARAQASE